MKTIKKILLVLVIMMAAAAGLVVLFRDQIKVAAVRTFIKRWTDGLLEGAVIDDAEKEKIKKEIADFYAMVVKEVIPERNVQQLWKDGMRNLGVWYFYLKNYFTTIIRESGMDVLARRKAIETINRFLGYIRDGRVSESDIKELGKKIHILDPTESALNFMEKEDIEKAVDKIEYINNELEKKGPGKPLDPLEKFKEIVERIREVTRAYEKEESNPQ